MTVQQYFVVESNVVTNSVMWDGDVNTWQPPTNSTMLIRSDTEAKVWAYDKVSNSYVLTTVLGAGGVGFTWDGSVLTTNEPQPAPPKAQPIATGTTTA